MVRLGVVACALAGPAGAAAQGGASAAPVVPARPATLALSFEEMRFATGEPLDLLGTRYQVAVGDDGWMVGPGLLSAMGGRRAGLFVIGAEAGFARAVARALTLEAGVFVGGGGGGSARVQGGLFVRPHVGLRVSAGSVAIDLGVSHLQVARDAASSTQLTAGLAVPLAFRTVAARDLELPHVAEAPTGMGFDVVEPLVLVYRPLGDNRGVSGVPLPDRFGLVGIRAEHAFTPALGVGVEGAGAATGGIAGYAEFGAHGWWRVSVLDDRGAVGVRAGVALAGGGDVRTGLVAKGALTTSLALTDALALRVEEGYLTAVGAPFEAISASFGIAWTLDAPVRDASPRAPVRTDWLLGLQQYAAARVGGAASPLTVVALHVNRFVSDAVYLTGQAHGALAGSAGGYSVGLVGAGAERAFGAGWSANLEGSLGAAGGGGVNTGGGALAQLLGAVAYEVTPGVRLRAGVGRTRSMSGALDATTTDVALAWTFGVAPVRRW
ncbi:MAG: hypothetical protein HY275_03960 [Gemmatimonadetes bacterium]|nr:hypothetical protein [Gemmatimonadota bacterium]